METSGGLINIDQSKLMLMLDPGYFIKSIEKI